MIENENYLKDKHFMIKIMKYVEDKSILNFKLHKIYTKGSDICIIEAIESLAYGIQNLNFINVVGTKRK